ncbi:MAG TPA: GTPase domain-containing protein, partial [Burkholderiaceae bacterium]|nr:GTPase domain-containing protein [Burkholderiaceae bacterium]
MTTEPINSESIDKTIEIALISHTNAGKTTLARTLLGRDIGEVRDAPHVTDLSEAHTLITTDQGDVLRLWDTPGFGDTTRLVKRLRNADNPIGWLLREVWDRWRDRPFWCSQQAVRTAREASDVVLYLVNASEQPHEAGYLLAEMDVLRWIERPTIVLLNQVGPPRGAAEERAEVERWRTHLAPYEFVKEVITLDAFARCWVQERVLLDAVGRVLAESKRAAFARLLAQWDARNHERFMSAMSALAEQLLDAARDREPVDQAVAPGALQKVLHAVGVGRDRIDAARERAMTQLAERLDRAIRRSTDQLIAL